jgi:hypothetical protein
MSMNTKIVVATLYLNVGSYAEDDHAAIAEQWLRDHAVIGKETTVHVEDPSAQDATNSWGEVVVQNAKVS